MSRLLLQVLAQTNLAGRPVHTLLVSRSTLVAPWAAHRSPKAAPIQARQMGRTKKNFFAVVRGRTPGVYQSWDACNQQVRGYQGNLYQGFSTKEEALQFMSLHSGSAFPAQPAPLGARKRHAESWAAADDAAGARADVEPCVPADTRCGDAEQPADEEQPAARIVPGRRLRLEFDGAAKGNPGPSGLGAVLYDDVTGAEVSRLCHYMGDHCTNNQAEYAALVAGLQAALDLGCDSIAVQGDSMLVINQVLGAWKVKHAGLAPYHASAVDLSRQFETFQARQVPREQNKVADALSNQAIDEWRSGAVRQMWSLQSVQRAGTGAGATDLQESNAKRQRR